MESPIISFAILLSISLTNDIGCLGKLRRRKLHSVSASWKSWRLWKRTPVSSRILDEGKPVGLKPFLSTVHPQPSHSTLGTFSTSEDHSVRHSSHSVFRDMACTVTQKSMIISAIRTPSAGDRFTRFFLAAKNLYNGQKPLLNDRRAITFHLDSSPPMPSSSG